MTGKLEEVKEIGRVKALLGILKLSDEEAYEHSMEVARIVEKYLEEEERENAAIRNRDEQEQIITGALLQDIGKGFLPFGLQYSSREFDEKEAEIMNTHPILGSVAIRNCEFSEITDNIILMHHAAADGSGYPRIANRILVEKADAVKNNREENAGYIEVPDYVWIVAYADKLDAMISRRNYRKQIGLKDAWSNLVNLSKENKLPYWPLNIYKTIIQDMDIFKGDWKEDTYSLPKKKKETDDITEETKSIYDFMRE